MSVAFKPKTGTTSEWQAAEAAGRIYDKHELLIEQKDSGKLRFKLGDGINKYSKLPVMYDQEQVDGAFEKADEAAHSADKAAATLINVNATSKIVADNLEDAVTNKAEISDLAIRAEQAALECKGYVGNTQVQIVTNNDDDGGLGIYINN